MTEELLSAIKSQPFVAKMFVLMSRAMDNEAIPKEIQELLAQMDTISQSVPLIIAGQRSGCIRDGDPKALSILFWRIIQGIAEEIAMHPDSPCPEAEWIVDLLRRKPE